MSGEKKTGPGKEGAKAAPGVTIEGETVEPKKKRTNPIVFLQQVRAEAEKVTWTTWNETWISTLMVLTMVVIMAIFFLIIDQGLKFGVCTILPIDCASQN